MVSTLYKNQGGFSAGREGPGKESPGKGVPGRDPGIGPGRGPDRVPGRGPGENLVRKSGAKIWSKIPLDLLMKIEPKLKPCECPTTGYSVQY